MKNILLILFSFLAFFPKTSQATIDGHTFYLEVAKTPTQQEIGLAKYSSIPENHAMYFPFQKADYYTFWMKNMHFSIDIIFIKNGKIVTIYSHVSVPTNSEVDLPTYRATARTNAVLEINAGLAKKYGFRIGDTVHVSL